jgi:FlaA1/EpsC-like NDP-sugar epimerase
LHNGIFQVVLDFLLILISYYSALLLRFEGNIPAPDLQLFFKTIPWFILIKVSMFIAFGAYRHIWRYFGLASLVVYGKAIALSSTLCLLFLLFADRFAGFSRAVFVMDAILLFFFIVASRMWFQIFQATVRKHTSETNGLQRVLIYGANERGYFLAKELEESAGLGYVPVGFIDNDPEKHSRSINGYMVFADTNRVVLESLSVQAVLVGWRDIPGQKLEAIQQLCDKMKVPMKRITIQIE